MYLTRDEERILDGEQGPSKKKAMELLVALGDIYKAERLISIASAQVSGASFKTIGEAGIKWLEGMSMDARATVPAMVNPLGLDMKRWRSMGISPEFHSRQERIIAAYEAMGLLPVYSCTPYLTAHKPRSGQHIAWAESSATVFANSVIGARTNREGGPSALAAAIIGKTAEYGLHLDENRVPRVQIKLEHVPEELTPIAGYLTGKIAGNRIPMVTGFRMTKDQHKSFGAAVAATGAVSMYAFEAKGGADKHGDQSYEETVEIGVSDLNRCADELKGGEEFDLVAIGCPHCSTDELREMAGRLKGKKPRGNADVWFCTSREAYAACPEAVSVLRGFGQVLCDTCMVVAPIEELYRSTATNSGKAMMYLPSLGRQKASFRTTDELLEAISR
ncbi:MAG: aconitase X catalytic domain-containing protein [Methanobacteriota archaeon]|nr:MAG: aconitase X catalytic domain-containing protein [Euryarchaeota archaeon]